MNSKDRPFIALADGVGLDALGDDDASLLDQDLEEDGQEQDQDNDKDNEDEDGEAQHKDETSGRKRIAAISWLRMKKLGGAMAWYRLTASKWSSRNQKECEVICSTLDQLINEAIEPSLSVAFEILIRRLSGLHAVELGYGWSVCSAIQWDNDTDPLPYDELQLALRSAATTERLQRRRTQNKRTRTTPFTAFPSYSIVRGGGTGRVGFGGRGGGRGGGFSTGTSVGTGYTGRGGATSFGRGGSTTSR